MLGLAALLLVLGGIFAMRRGGGVSVQVVTATPISGSEGGGAGAGAASVTANGYVVARTRASVSAKLPGRIADLRVSEGSNVKRGEIIALLDNADYQAQAARGVVAETRGGNYFPGDRHPKAAPCLSRRPSSRS